MIALKDTKRLEAFISEWPAFDRLYDYELSFKLLRYWREVRIDPCFNFTDCTQYCRDTKKNINQTLISEQILINILLQFYIAKANWQCLKVDNQYFKIYLLQYTLKNQR